MICRPCCLHCSNGCCSEQPPLHVATSAAAMPPLHVATHWVPWDATVDSCSTKIYEAIERQPSCYNPCTNLRTMPAAPAHRPTLLIPGRDAGEVGQVLMAELDAVKEPVVEKAVVVELAAVSEPAAVEEQAIRARWSNSRSKRSGSKPDAVKEPVVKEAVEKAVGGEAVGGGGEAMVEPHVLSNRNDGVVSTLSINEDRVGALREPCISQDIDAAARRHVIWGHARAMCRAVLDAISVRDQLTFWEAVHSMSHDALIVEQAAPGGGSTSPNPEAHHASTRARFIHRIVSHRTIPQHCCKALPIIIIRCCDVRYGTRMLITQPTAPTLITAHMLITQLTDRLSLRLPGQSQILGGQCCGASARGECWDTFSSEL